MESISCTCKECGAAIGDFTNLWAQIGKSYFSPLVESPSELEIELHGPVRLGEKSTLVESCQLQDIACAQCKAILGIKCLSTPTNHVLDESQILLRATSMVPVNLEDGTEVDLVVKRHLKLRESSRTGAERSSSAANGDRTRGRDPSGAAAHDIYHSPEGPDLIDISQLQADLDAQRGDIERIDSAGFKVVSALDEAVTRVEGGLAKTKQTLSDLQREIRGNHEDLSSLKIEITDVKRVAHDRTAINRLEDQLAAAKKCVEEVRQSLQTATTQFRQDLTGVKSAVQENRDSLDELRILVKDRISARDHAKEIASVRSEIAQLRKQMDDTRSKPPESFPSRELDILTSNIAKIGNRASQVESLQMEFEIFKGRVERMENNNRHGRPSLQSNAEETSPYDQYDTDDFDTRDALPTRRKRRSSGLDDSSIPGSSSTKRAAFATKVAGTPDRASEWEPNPSSGPISRSISVRLTKAGKVDKRSQRNPNRASIGISSDPKTAGTRRRG